MKNLNLFAVTLLIGLSASAYTCNEIAGSGQIDITSDPGSISVWNQSGETMTFSLRRRQAVTNDHELQTMTARNGMTIRVALSDLVNQTNPSLIIVNRQMFRCD